MSQITIKTLENGAVEIRMEGGTPFDWCNLMQSALSNVQEQLEKIDPAKLSNDDQQVYEWVSNWAEEILELNDCLEQVMEAQKTDSHCEFFYGSKDPTP